MGACLRVCTFGFMGQNESCRELQNGKALGDGAGEVLPVSGKILARVGPVLEGI